MSRYVDAERMPYGDTWDALDDKEKATVLSFLIQLPTADVKERKYGEWIKKKHLIPLAWDSGPFIWENYDEETHSEWKEYWHCSECGYEASRDMKPRFKYCPECGVEIKLNDSEE